MRIAVLLLYYRQPQYIDACIQSLLGQSYSDMQIVCIDNASGDGIVEGLTKRFPHVITHQMTSNGGYSKTYNVWLKQYFKTGYDACLVMNVDTVADRGMVKELVDSYKRAASAGVKVGLLQPAILLMSDPKKINTIGNRIHFTGFGYCPDYKKPLSIIPKVDVAISFVSGCCMFIPKEYFDRLGGFDERYFMYMEDQEYSVRGTINGYTHLLSVGSRLVHNYTLKLSSKKIWRILKGWVRFIISYPFVSLRLTRSF